MNEYTNVRLRKKDEQELLDYFLDAYERITGETSKVLVAAERPDFICIRGNESVVGVELAKVRRGHPNDIQWDERE